jgi:hypothetical protein
VNGVARRPPATYIEQVKPNLAVTMFLLAGCSTNNPVPVDLEIKSAIAELANGTTNEIYVVAALSNNGGSAALPTDPLEFTLADNAGNIYEPSALTSSEPCDASYVAPGSTTTCSLAFEVPQQQMATELTYDDQNGDVIAIAIPSLVDRSTVCTQVQAALDGPENACEACVANAMQTSCAQQYQVHTQACSCSQTCADADDPCGCELQCDSTSCEELFQAANECTITACAAMCS